MGTGQGSVISPLLANIYLHYVFDLWAERWRRREATGDMIIVRYADDIVVGFEHESDATRPHAGQAPGDKGRATPAYALRHPRTGGMAQTSRSRLLCLPRSADKFSIARRVSWPHCATLAPRPSKAQSKGPLCLGTNVEARQRMASSTPHPSPVAQRPLRRQTLKVGAVCVNWHARICAGGGQQWPSLPRTSRVQHGQRQLWSAPAARNIVAAWV